MSMGPASAFKHFKSEDDFGKAVERLNRIYRAYWGWHDIGHGKPSGQTPGVCSGTGETVSNQVENDRQTRRGWEMQARHQAGEGESRPDV